MLLKKNFADRGIQNNNIQIQSLLFIHWAAVTMLLLRDLSSSLLVSYRVHGFTWVSWACAWGLRESHSNTCFLVVRRVRLQQIGWHSHLSMLPVVGWFILRWNSCLVVLVKGWPVCEYENWLVRLLPWQKERSHPNNPGVSQCGFVWWDMGSVSRFCCILSVDYKSQTACGIWVFVICSSVYSDVMYILCRHYNHFLPNCDWSIFLDTR